MKLKLFGLAIASLLIYSCASKQVVQTTTEAPKAIELTAAQQHGKGLYEQNCAKCHKLFEPSKHNAEEWKVTLARMQKKAKISDEDTASIYGYLTAGM
ncbi:cytochrome c [Flavobacterium sp. SM15]|uniref:c-type cytochrome n=1 Tax=Flavobacterium sp. SM15 TaxID=2908005 RepID=UPI001EDC88FF|nr:cytochrome c [Flavobacterium sp. SM15]MCG2611759.1 cytochrome c [Flavobacterium sp. SM15]